MQLERLKPVLNHFLIFGTQKSMLGTVYSKPVSTRDLAMDFNPVPFVFSIIWDLKSDFGIRFLFMIFQTGHNIKCYFPLSHISPSNKPQNQFLITQVCFFISIWDLKQFIKSLIISLYTKCYSLTKNRAHNKKAVPGT